MFEHEFNRNEWHYDNLVYTFHVPLLTTLRYDSNMKRSVDVIENKYIHYQYKEGRYTTDIKIELPTDINNKLWKCVDGVISVQHLLCEPLWTITLDICKSAFVCDIDSWMSSWETLQNTIRDFHKQNDIVDAISEVTCLPYDMSVIIANKTLFTQDNWSYGVNDHIMYHLSHALGNNIEGANTLFEKVLQEGGLTKERIMKLIALHVVRKEPCNDWICVKTRHDGFYCCIHRRLFETFDLNIEDVKEKVRYASDYPIGNYTIHDKYRYRW